jgi:hypothetical protein
MWQMRCYQSFALVQQRAYSIASMLTFNKPVSWLVFPY